MKYVYHATWEDGCTIGHFSSWKKVLDGIAMYQNDDPEAVSYDIEKGQFTSTWTAYNRDGNVQFTVYVEKIRVY